MRLALISDIHEDVVSLEKALKAIEREHCHEIICLGDILGFSDSYYDHGATRNASECIRLVKDNCITVIPGNHDYHALKRIPLANVGFQYPENWYQLSDEQQADIADGKVWLYNDGELEAKIDYDQATWLAALPEYQTTNIGEDSVLFSHYIYPNITGSLRKFYFEAHEFEQHKTFMKEQGALVSFCGHRHYLGLMVVSHKVLSKRFNKTYRLKEYDSVLIPPVVSSHYESGFCIFDTNRKTVTAKRI